MNRPPIVVVSALLLAACSGQSYSVNSEYEYPRQVAQTAKLYAARDACLKRNVQPFVNTLTDPETAARIVAATCEMETAKLIAVSNPSGAADVAEAIRKDSAFRAAGMLMRARGVPQTN